MAKENAVYKCTGILFSHNKRRESAIGHNIDEAGGPYAK
jgi:hypothetical protein